MKIVEGKASLQAFESWLNLKSVKYTNINGIFIFEDFKLLLVEPLEGSKLIDSLFRFIDYELIESYVDENTYLAFEFGYHYYYSKLKEDGYIDLKSFKWLGKYNNLMDFNMPHLGVHTGFDLLSAVGTPKDYVKKAKFLGVDTLGICDKHTLAGTYNFYKACKAEGIKPIIGATIITNEGSLKLYVKNEIGWRNLSSIVSQIQINKLLSINHQEVFDRSEGLVCVMGVCFEIKDYIDKYIEYFQDDLYFAINFLEWSSESRDNKQILWIKECLPFDESFVWIHDSYYIDKEDYEAKKLINTIGGINLPSSEDQWFKSDTELVNQAYELFSDSNFGLIELEKLVNNTVKMSEKCSGFEFDFSRKLPQYVLTKTEEMLFDDKEDLFWHQIDTGLNCKVKPKDEEEFNLYISRVEKEFKVIKDAGVLDYFLILYDFCRECRARNILVGFGRGSAAGSLISYLLDIVEIDPIKYNLLFERFLNEGRAQKSLPDIDTDIEDVKRDQAKQYLVERYTHDRVSNVGTYSMYKLKSLLTDVLKYLGVEFGTVKLATSTIGKDFEDSFEGLMACAASEPKLLSILQKYSDFQPLFEAIIGQPRSMGVHASASIIVPIRDGQGKFENYTPVTEIDGYLVTQLQGTELDELGFLKADILGLAQLSKFSQTLELIKKANKTVPDIYNLNLEDRSVYDYFHSGWNEDVFQFGSPSQKKYSVYLKPDNIEELTAANALYRPGPMDSGAHNHYVELKFGQRVLKFDPFLDDVTKDTVGLYVYQEQVMAAYSKIAKTSLIESDSFRKFITKLKGNYWDDPNYLEYKDKFIKGYEELGVYKNESLPVWEKILAFGAYGFNRSHAASYSVMGYIAQYLKVHYPLEFWTVSLKNSKNDEIQNKLYEIALSGSIKVLPPSINVSTTEFTTNGIDTIYWSISSIYGCGEASLSKLMEERDTNGSFYSIEEFFKRCSKLVNKTVMYNLAYAGAFDDICDVKRAKDRLNIVEKLDSLRNEKTNTIEIGKNHSFISNWWWQLKSKQICGYDGIDYESLRDYLDENIINKRVISIGEMEDFESSRDNDVVIIGIVKKVNPMTTKGGKKMCKMIMEQKSISFGVVLWEDSSIEYSSILDKSLEGNLIAISGSCSFDSYRQQNTIYSKDNTFIQIFC